MGGRRGGWRGSPRRARAEPSFSSSPPLPFTSHPRRPGDIARVLARSGLVTARVGARQAANEHLMVLRVAWRGNPHLPPPPGAAVAEQRVRV